MAKIATFGSLLAAVGLVASCSSSGTSAARTAASSTLPQSSATASPSVAPEPTTFTSKAYGYTATVPAGWTSRQAYEPWDGEWELDGQSVMVDLIGQPAESSGVWAAAARTKRDLAADARYAIVWNAHYHGDTCPHPPTRTHVTVGGRPGVLLAYNCGILVNQVVTVNRGIQYWFVFVDQSVARATDPTDHATFMKILRSVRFPA